MHYFRNTTTSEECLYYKPASTGTCFQLLNANTEC